MTSNVIHLLQIYRPIQVQILSARLYAIARYMLQPGVRLSQVGVLLKRPNWTSWISVSAYHILYVTGIRVSPKVKALPSETVSQMLNLADFLFLCRGTSIVACCQLSSTDDRRHIAPSVHLCLQHVRDAARRAGSSVVQHLSTVADAQSLCGSMLVTLCCLSYQGVALTGRNRTVPPCSVGRRTGRAPGPAAADRPRALQTTTDGKRRRAKQYWPIRRASYKVLCDNNMKELNTLGMDKRKLERDKTLWKRLINSFLAVGGVISWWIIYQLYRRACRRYRVVRLPLTKANLLISHDRLSIPGTSNKVTEVLCRNYNLLRPVDR